MGGFYAVISHAHHVVISAPPRRCAIRAGATWIRAQWTHVLGSAGCSDDSGISKANHLWDGTTYTGDTRESSSAQTGSRLIVVFRPERTLRATRQRNAGTRAVFPARSHFCPAWTSSGSSAPACHGGRLQRGERGWTVPVPLHPDEASILS